jgi:hypothetical protein
VTALFKARQIRFQNGLSVELGRHDGLDFRQPIKPLDQLLAWLAVVEALVEFLADGQGQPVDFAEVAADARKAGLGGGRWLGGLDVFRTIFITI